MNMMTRLLSWVVTLLTVIAIVMTAVRLMLLPAFLTFEYNTPGFPDDTYGFTKADRLHWANLSMEYLMNAAGVEFVGDLRFPDGSPVFNQRELQHFVDVKIVLTRALNVWIASLLLLVALGFFAGREHWSDEYRDGLRRGAWLTVIAIVGILLFVGLAFNVLFVAFHNVFFDPGTWTFNWSDTFIRLFPQRFWRDIFIYVGGLSIGGALGVIFFLRKR
jgi:integral membrane protein (TIGR01906 family)